MEKKNIFLSFLDKFLGLPLWIKEVLYVQLKEDIEKYSISATHGILDKTDLYQYYEPTLTYLGKKELYSRSIDLPQNMYRFLEGASQGLDILEITLNNFWTLEETANLNLQAIEKELVTAPVTANAKATAMYLAGKIRLGEYFKHIGKLDVDQLDATMRRQKEIEATGQRAGIASVMIDLGFVTEEETKMILYIKDECKKRFIFNTDILAKSSVTSAPVTEKETSSDNQAVVERLAKENALLRQKLMAIADVLRK